MYLRQLDIVGFRGINRLSFTLQPNMVLIGENAWGKSSLLAALSCIFNGKLEPYEFQAEDFYFSDKNEVKSQSITILCTFRAYHTSKTLSDFPYKELVIFDDDNYAKVYFQIRGEMQEGKIITHYHFLDKQGDSISFENKEKVVQALIALHPIYRFRDARLNSSFNPVNINTSLNQLEDPKLNQEVQSLIFLLQHYFLNQTHTKELMQDTSTLWNNVKSLCMKLRQDKNDVIRNMIFNQLGNLFIAQNEKRNFHTITPIVLFEDPESRLHPRMIAILWELIGYLPIQRITTTNSAELISQVPLHDICRLIRNAERTEAFQLSHQLNKEELRRLTFHIHHNRSLALFSRMWLLVEGETEVWILNELAELLGIHLAMEGIRIVEFAQCGLRPLLHYAKTMGIEWYVLTDGDDAGKKYAQTVKGFLSENEMLSTRLTQLPKKDIEHFFYYSGFDELFIRLARWQDNQKSIPYKIIQKAIQRTSKPDLAIALSNEIKQRGTESIPSLFKRLFTRVLTLAHNA